MIATAKPTGQSGPVLSLVYAMAIHGFRLWSPESKARAFSRQLRRLEKQLNYQHCRTFPGGKGKKDPWKLLALLCSGLAASGWSPGTYRYSPDPQTVSISTGRVPSVI